ncbi:MAG: 50S ribosomal protein L12 [Candidatus Aenigmatarchaeota archaeon]
MEYIYATLLLHSAKLPITEENINKILSSVGITPDPAKVKAVVTSLENVNMDEILQQAAVAVAAPTKTEEKKKEEKEEEGKKAEEAAAGHLTLVMGS